MEVTDLGAKVLQMQQELSPMESEHKTNGEYNNFVKVSATDTLLS